MGTDSADTASRFYCALKHTGQSNTDIREYNTNIQKTPIMDLTSVPFRRYPSFQNHYREKTIEAIRKRLAEENEDRFIATEKLHGSNFAIYCNGTDIRCARRNGFLEPNENFHNGQVLAAALKSNILCVYAEVENTHKPENDEPFYVIIYGEIYGGSVQVGVSYGDDVKFRAFDISVEQKASRKFVPYDDFKRITGDFEIPVVPVIAEGTLNELLARNAQFTSTILNEDGNNAEGYVLKYFKEYTFDDLDEIHRLMIKYKNPRFDEFASVPKKQKNLCADLSDADAMFLAEQFQTRLTFMRLQAVKSKLTPKQAKNRNLMTDEMYKDVVDDLGEVQDADESLKNDGLVAQAKKMTSTFVGNNIKLLSLTASDYKTLEGYVTSMETIDQEELDKMVAAGELKATFHIPQLREVMFARIKRDHPGFEMKGALAGVVNQKVMELAKELVGMNK